MIDLTKIEVPNDEKICDLFMDQVVNACVSVCDEVGLFSAISEKFKTSKELEREVNSNAASIEVVFRVLVAAGLLIKQKDEYGLVPFTKAYFLKSSPIYRGYQFKNNILWYGKILNTLKSGSGWSPVGADGKSFTSMWEDGSLSQEAADRFTGMMHTNIAGPAIAVARSGVFNNFQHIIDVGGGSGIFLTALKQHFPHMKVTLLELPQVCEAAKKFIKNYIDPSSIEYFPCNIFSQSWPDFGDAFFLSNVLHDWPQDKASKILKNAFNALQSKSSIFIYECLLSEDRVSPKHTVILDLLMYSNHQSQQYTEKELSSMLADVGFQNPRKVFEFGYYTLIQADKT